MTVSRSLRVGVVAGEHSGDMLGASLIRALKQRYPKLEAFGIAGPKMISEGVESFFPMERLSVMGIVEPLSRLPELLSIRAKLFKSFCRDSPDIFLGIDSPDFNLGLEGKLKNTGIPTVHIVSPSVWAWRPGRVKKVARCVDTLLCLFPFEPSYYSNFHMKAKFVGHPLANELDDLDSRELVRESLGLKKEGTVLAMLPGSRMSEVRALMGIFLETALIFQRNHPNTEFLVPAVNQSISKYLIEQLQDYPKLKVRLLNGKAREAILASNAVLMASGTATLEAALMLRPMVVAYKMAPLSWAIVSQMASARFASLPNILAKKRIVPEYLQTEVRAEVLAGALIEIIDSKGKDAQVEFFLQLKDMLRQDYSRLSVEAIEEMLGY